MKGDFSRLDPVRRRNLNGVLHQQGRVLLDRDWNDQTRLAIDWQDIAGRDIIGPGVLAVPAEAAEAFLVTAVRLEADGTVRVTLEPGRGWADGWLVELPANDDGTPVERLATPLDPPFQTPPDDTGAEDTRDAVVLEVWREALNGFQLPDPGLLEPALGGPDTTERVHTAMRLRLFRLGEDDTCQTVAERLQDDPATRGRLTASLEPTTTTPGDCPVVEGGGYSGFEHHLYRIEIAETDASDAHFKWSAFNGGLVGRGTFRLDGTDKVFRIEANDQPIKTSGLERFYLEVIRYDEEHGHFHVTYGAEATLNGDDLEIGAEHFTAFGNPPEDEAVFFRLWNAIAPTADFPGTGDPSPLQDGIHLAFDADAGDNYRPDDYWTFEVRAGDIETPETLIDDAPPEGVRYVRVPLAILHWSGADEISFDAGEIHDCRDVFRPLTGRDRCCTFTVGDDVRSRGDFNRLEDAVRHLPARGGQLCLLPGRHQANVALTDRRDIHFTGCGVHTMLHPRPEQASTPIFRIAACRNIQIDHLSMMAAAGTAVRVIDPDDASQDTRGIHILDNDIIACEHAVEIRVDNGQAGDNDIWIARNRIGMLDKEGGQAAILCTADAVLIERNRLVVVPPPAPDDPDDPRPADGPPDVVFDPCADAAAVYASDTSFYATYLNLILYIISYVASLRAPTYRTRGGIQIGGGSERVRIIGNEITGGAGHGITLGDLPLAPDADATAATHGMTYLRDRSVLNDARFVSALYDVTIEENRITNMGLSGIGPAAFFDPEVGLVIRVEGLTVYRNTITHCTRQIPAEALAELRGGGLFFGELAFGGVTLAACQSAVIQENRIESNGADHLNPTCGLFIQHGQQIDVSNNRILYNGFTQHDDVERGTRGGIVVVMASELLAGALSSLLAARTRDGVRIPYEGVPAARIHDNVVLQPHGQALVLFALGPVSVLGNHFTTQGSDYRVNPLSVLAAAVFILNLGASKDVLRMILPALQEINRVSAEPTKEVDDPLAALQRITSWPGGSVLFADNRTTLDLRAEDIGFALASQIIGSLDDVSFHDNVSECTSLLDVVFINTALGAVSVRAAGNRFQEGITLAFYSLFAYGLLMSTATGNQASHCLLVGGGKKLERHNLILNESFLCEGQSDEDDER